MRALRCLRTIASIAPLVVGGVTFGWGTAPGQDADIASLLDRYARGDHEAARRIDIPAADLEGFRRAFETDAPTWVTTGGLSAVDSRRLVVAAFVLDLVDGNAGGSVRGAAVFSLIEWACQVVRSGASPTVGEREWHVASAILLRKLQHHLGLYGAPSNISALRLQALEKQIGPLLGHLRHSRARFPVEARLELMEADRHVLLAGRLIGVREVPQDEFSRMRAQDGANRRRRQEPGSESQRHPSDWILSEDVRLLSGLLEDRRALTDLLRREQVRPAVHLRLGVIAMCFGERAVARQHFTDADRVAVNPDEKYLSRFLLGRALELEDDLAGAEHAYRAALVMVPRAQSAMVTLGGLLFTTGRRAEAGSIAEQTIAGPAERDPWLHFLWYGYIGTTDYLAPLRAAVLAR